VKGEYTTIPASMPVIVGLLAYSKRQALTQSIQYPHRPTGNEQLKFELKEHFDKSMAKIENMLKTHAKQAEEDRQRVSSVHAEVVKARHHPNSLWVSPSVANTVIII